MANEPSQMQFKASMQRMFDQWPVEAERAARLCREFLPVWNEKGQSRFEAAVTHMITYGQSKYFPALAEFLMHMPVRTGVRNCGKCQSGWVVAYYDKNKMPFMKRCECKGGAEADKRISRDEWRQ